MLEIKNVRVYLALKDVAKNLLALESLSLPKYPNIETVAFFAISRSGEQKAEIVIHGVKKEDLRKLIAGCNSYVFRDRTIFGQGIGYRVPLDDIMQHVILVKDNRYESKICTKVAIFNKSEM